MWKFCKDSLSWEIFPLEPSREWGMLSLTSAEEVHDPGSRSGICGKDPAPSSGQAAEETEALSNSSHGSKLHSHSSPEGFPSGEEQTSTIPSPGGISDSLHPKSYTWQRLQGTLFEVTTRCRAELTALTSWAGFEWRFKPAGGTSCIKPRQLGSWLLPR